MYRREVLKEAKIRIRRAADSDDEDRIFVDPEVYSLRPGTAEWHFVVQVLGFLDEGGETPSPLLPTFLILAEQSPNNGRITNWHALPLKNRAPTGFDGYSFVIGEMFDMLGQTYESSDQSSRSHILQLLALARKIREGRQLDVDAHSALRGRRNARLRQSHENVIELWTRAIKKLEQAVGKCADTADRDTKYRNDKDDGGSANGTQRSKDGENSQSTKRPTTKAAGQLGGCKKEYRGPGHNNYLEKSLSVIGTTLDVGTRITAFTGGLAAGGIGAVVMDTMITAAAGLAQPAAYAAAFPAAKVVTIGTVLAGPAVILPAVFLASTCAGGILIKWAIRR